MTTTLGGYIACLTFMLIALAAALICTRVLREMFASYWYHRLMALGGILAIYSIAAMFGFTALTGDCHVAWGILLALGIVLLFGIGLTLAALEYLSPRRSWIVPAH